MNSFSEKAFKALTLLTSFLVISLIISSRLSSPDVEEEESEGVSQESSTEIAPYYSCGGQFLNFKFDHIEFNTAVKLVDWQGLPQSQQWESQGFYYPTMIASSGLGYYNQALQSVSSDEPSQKVYLLQSVEGEYQVANGEAISRFPYLEFKAKMTSLDSAISFLMTISLMSMGDVRDHVIITFQCSKESPTLFVRFFNGVPELVYTVPTCPMHEYATFHREIFGDVIKGLILGGATGLENIHLNEVNLVILRGSGEVEGVAMVSELDFDLATEVATWFYQHQEDDGTWPTPVNTGSEFFSHPGLETGWRSATSQGLAMSLLVRAYKLTGDPFYAVTALKAVDVFEVPVSENGVLAKLMEYDWYEMYPTEPSSFVLHGHIYALIGLYEVFTCIDVDDSKLINSGQADVVRNGVELARERFETGLKTLVETISLFDTGVSTLLSLEHKTNPDINPHVATDDLQIVHLTQLQWLENVDKANSNLWHSTFAKWSDYIM